MDPIHREVLQTKLTYLTKELDANEISNELLARKLLTEREYQELKSNNTSEDRTSYLVTTLWRKGPNAYTTFLEVLAVNSSWIVDDLTSTEEKLRSRNKTTNVESNASGSSDLIASQPDDTDATPLDDVDAAGTQSDTFFSATEPTISGIQKPEDCKSPFTSLEKLKLLGMYNTWQTNLNPDELIKHLPASCREQMPTELNQSNKAEMLFYHVLMNSYDDLCEVRRALEKSTEDSHKKLADKIPNRVDEISSNLQDCDVRSSDDEVPSPIQISEFTSMTAGPGITALPTSRIKTIYGLAESKPCGKGLCVIICNFSKHLVGYEKDAMALESFFRDELSYTVMGPSSDFNNMGKKRFTKVLETIRSELNEAKTKYDRFFLFVLSHGDNKGILMCKEGNGNFDKKATYQRHPIKDIVEMFSHDAVPSMANKPKCFFFQACRGPKIVPPTTIHIVANPQFDGDGDQPGDPTPPNDPDPIQMLAPGSDMLVCYPSAEETTSFVQKNGSIFIQKCVDVFREYYKSDHLLDMMVEVASLVSAEDAHMRYQQQLVGPFRQMPHLVSSLTRKLYLYLEQ